MTRKRLIVEAAAVSILGVILSLALYSEWSSDCCLETSRGLIGALTLPAVLFASLLAGGVHGATPGHFVVGMVMELLFLWGVFTLGRHCLTIYSTRTR